MLAEFPEAFVQGAAEGGDFACVFRDGFLAPSRIARAIYPTDSTASMVSRPIVSKLSRQK